MYGLIMAIFFLQGCNNGENEIISFEIHEAAVDMEEGRQQFLSYTADTIEEYEVSFEQLTGTKAFIEAKNNQIHFIVPSVAKDELIQIKINLRTESGKLAESSIEFNALNTVLPQLETMPEPNVFSSGNVEKHFYKPFDSAGIPLTARAEGEFYYPVSIAAYAYDYYSYYNKSREEEALDKFLVVATWLRDNCVYTEYGFCSYRSYFPIESYKLTTDWTTAMGQGQAISSLIAAHYLTGDDSFAQVAQDALSAFLYPVEVKGLVADFDGQTWFEEYGSEEMPAHVLNGMFFSLSGVRDFVKNYKTKLADDIFAVGTESVKKNIHLFDHKYTTRYDYSPLMQFASSKKGPDAYHELHILQLGWLYNVTGEQVLLDYTHEFLKQDMAGIKLINSRIYDKSIEILALEASNTFDAEKLGTNKAIDGYWTYNRYWASYEPTVDLTLTVNEDIIKGGKLDRVVMTGVFPKDLPQSFDVYEVLATGEEVLLKENIKLDDFKDTGYSFEVGGYYSHTVVFDVFVPVTTNKILLRLTTSDTGLLKIRELDIHYPRPELLEELLTLYPK